MNLLFVCSRNQWRSPTAEMIYRDHLNHTARSAGTAAAAKVRLTPKLIEWADIIFVMEYHHKQIVQEKFRQYLTAKQIIVLDIPDDYSYMDPELIDMLRTSIEPILSGKL